MKKGNIYIGNINIVENGEIYLYQECSPLLLLENNNYINLEWIVSFKDYLKLYRGLLTGFYSNEIIISDKIPKSGIYVDKQSLLPYYNETNNENISIKKVKEEIMLDPRLPGGNEILENGTIVEYIKMPNPKKIR